MDKERDRELEDELQPTVIHQKTRRRKNALRVDIIVIVTAMILAVTFFAYMLNTTLEDVLADERGEGVIITHTQSEAE